MAAVANTGRDANWTGHDLAGANLYGFGRLAFAPQLSAEGDRQRVDFPADQQRQRREQEYFRYPSSFQRGL